MKNIKRKLKIEKFFKEQLWQFTIVIAFVCFCAWIFNKPFEAFMFCVGHIVIRKHFDKQYHCGTTAICIFTTLTIAFLGIASSLPIAISLLSTIPITCFICWVGYLVQYKIDLLKYNRELKKQLEDIDLYKMSEEELRNYAKLKHISEPLIDTLVLRVIHNYKWVEIEQERNFTKDGIRYHREQLNKKLNIKL